MRKYFLTFVTIFSIFIFSCSEENQDHKLQNPSSSQVTEMIPNWEKGQEIISIKRKIPVDLNEIDLELSIIAREESLENGNFDLKIHWMFETNTRKIQIPVVPEKLYTNPSIEEVKEKEYHIGYIDQDEIFHVLYKIDFVNNNLRFKQIKSFNLK
ncbi:MAG TPA: hypothetical protein VK027_02605 [Chitinophagaceae bacterium]|nr:hypothetical protein [Chitinophagaceae bacterium]